MGLRTILNHLLVVMLMMQALPPSITAWLPGIRLTETPPICRAMFHGTVNGATLGTDRHGVAGMAYSFDGVDDYINVVLALSDFTLSSWVRINEFNQNNLSAIISRMAIANNGFELRIEPDGFPILVKGIGSSWNHLNSNKSLEQSRWAFLMAISKEIYLKSTLIQKL